MPKKAATGKRPRKVATLTERIGFLADAWEREAKTLGAYLTPEHRADNNHPSGHNRAYHRFAGQVNAIEYWPSRVREEVSLCATDEQRIAMLYDFRTEMDAARLQDMNFLDDNAEHIYLPTQWELEGKVLKLKHLMDALDDLVKAHNEQRKG